MEKDAGTSDNGRVPDLEPLLCFDVYAAHQAFGRLYKTYLAPLGLTYAQYLVLLLLGEDRRMTVGEIGHALGLESNTLTPLLKRMQHAGFVSRRRDAQDERRVIVELTADGIAMREQARKVPRCMAEAVGLREAEMRDLQSRLRRLTRYLGRASGEDTES